MKLHVGFTVFCTYNLFPLQTGAGSSLNLSNDILTIVFVPLFLWLTDLFLVRQLVYDLYFDNHNGYTTALPGLDCLDSLSGLSSLASSGISRFGRLVIVLLSGFESKNLLKPGCEIAWMIQGVKIFGLVLHDPKGPTPSANIFYSKIRRWVPGLAFSSGLDILLTGMIAGRLIQCHRRWRRLQAGHSDYLPVIAIFIESATLSTIAKLLQLAITSNAVAFNLIVIPLCVRKLSHLAWATVYIDPYRRFHLIL